MDLGRNNKMAPNTNRQCFNLTQCLSAGTMQLRETSKLFVKIPSTC